MVNKKGGPSASAGEQIGNKEATVDMFKVICALKTITHG